MEVSVREITDLRRFEVRASSQAEAIEMVREKLALAFDGSRYRVGKHALEILGDGLFFVEAFKRDDPSET